MHRVSHRIFFFCLGGGGGGGGEGSRIKNKTNCYTSKFEVIKRCHKVIKLTTRITKERAPD